MVEQFANNADSTLNGAINNSTTTIIVADGSVFPSDGYFRLIFGTDPDTAEYVIATARSGNTITVIRGVEGSTAQSWADGTIVTHIVTAGAIITLRDTLKGKDLHSSLETVGSNQDGYALTWIDGDGYWAARPGSPFTIVGDELYTTKTLAIDENGTVASEHGDGYSKLYVNGNILANKFSAGEIPLTTQSFNYVSDTLQTFTVPDGVTLLKVKMWGPGGGTGNYSGSGGGGAGGYSTGFLTVTPGEVLYLAVGSGGKKPTSTNPGPGGLGGWPGGGFGTAGDASGAGGGGLTGIFSDNSITQANALIIAGGGGGSTGFGNFGAGGGGGTTGGSGSSTSGKGGSQIAGGADGNSNAATSTTIASGSNGQTLPQGTINVASSTSFPSSGVLLVTTDAGIQIVRYTGKGTGTFTGCTGGTGTMSTGGAVIYAIAGSALTGGIAFSDRTSFQPTGSDCGGGGSGYFGGGAGQGDGRAGGGGSGFLHATRILSGSTTTGSSAIGGTSATSPPNTTDVNYSAGVGVGAAATGASGNDGGNGYIVLQWGGITTLDLDSIDFGNTASISTVDTNITMSSATNGTVSLSAAGAGGIALAPGSGNITISSSNDIIVSSGTSDIKFNIGGTPKYKIYSTGAVVVGDTTNNDTASEAQAGLTGPLINLSPITGGTLSSISGQSLVYNNASFITLQGHSGVSFRVNTGLVGHFDSNGIYRIGPSSNSSATLQGSTWPIVGTDYFWMYNSTGSSWAEIVAGGSVNRSAVQVLNNATSNTCGVSLFGAGTGHGTPEYAGNGTIEQSGNSTSALIFTKRNGTDGASFASTGAIWQSGAWTIGRATNNDTSSEAQAGLTGPLLNVTQTTGGTLTTVANQALLYNIAGTVTLQGNTGHNFITGTTSVASTSTSKFITSLGRRVRTTVTTTSLTVVDGYDVIIVGTLSAPITITLPSSPTAGDTYIIKDQGGTSATYNITVSGNGNNIDGAASYVISANYQSITVIFANGTWSII